MLKTHGRVYKQQREVSRSYHSNSDFLMSSSTRVISRPTFLFVVSYHHGKYSTYILRKKAKKRSVLN